MQKAYPGIKIILNGRVEFKDFRSELGDLEESVKERRAKDACKKNTAIIRSIYDIEEKIIPEKSESKLDVDEI